jgi:hypothetical protein
MRNTDRIAGWLLLPAWGLVGATLLGGRSVLVRLAVHEPDLETLLGAVWIGFTAAVASLLFRRYRHAPILAVVHLSLTAMAGVGGFLLVLNEADRVRTNALITMVTALVSAGIWIPYFLKSGRVKLTFRSLA